MAAASCGWQPGHATSRAAICQRRAFGDEQPWQFALPGLPLREHRQAGALSKANAAGSRALALPRPAPYRNALIVKQSNLALLGFSGSPCVAASPAMSYADASPELTSTQSTPSWLAQQVSRFPSRRTRK